MSYDHDDCLYPTTLGFDVVRVWPDGITHRLGTYASLRTARATAATYRDAKVVTR